MARRASASNRVGSLGNRSIPRDHKNGGWLNKNDKTSGTFKQKFDESQKKDVNKTTSPK